MRESERDFNAASAAIMEQHVGAAPVVSDPMLAGLRGVIATSAARHAMAIVFRWREFVAAGGSVSHGSSVTRVRRQVSIYRGVFSRWRNEPITVGHVSSGVKRSGWLRARNDEHSDAAPDPCAVDD